MKTSLKGMLILSVYYILVLPIKFFMYNCVSNTLCLHSFRYAIPHDIILWAVINRFSHAVTSIDSFSIPPPPPPSWKTSTLYRFSGLCLYVFSTHLNGCAHTAQTLNNYDPFDHQISRYFLHKTKQLRSNF